MKDSVSGRHGNYPSTIELARERIQHIRQRVHRCFGKSQKPSAHAGPLPSTPTNIPHKVLRPEYNAVASSLFDSTTSLTPAMDGSGEKRRSRTSCQATISAIFVHAGAGYHSGTNENVHLGACNDAARMAMKLLKAGGTAVDAVEAAIRVLEDKEITNAGYGSNLTIEGIVECDATVVDHLGRSGACGATAKIKNPIHLARVILETSSQPLSLRRVPPNLLVGDGATDFAYARGIPIVPHDANISKNSRERFRRWKEDLTQFNNQQLTPEPGNDVVESDSEKLDLEYEEKVKLQQKRDHFNALVSGTWNEGQPDSPAASSPAPETDAAPSPPFFTTSPVPRRRTPDHNQMPDKRHLSSPCSPCPESRNTGGNATPSKRPRIGGRSSTSHVRTRSLLGPNDSIREVSEDRSHNISTGSISSALVYSREEQGADGSISPNNIQGRQFVMPTLSMNGPVDASRLTDIVDDEDLITDTVGAIAIDSFGNIAAASSSGGIGMKHRGRIGPAALVGVGTAVVPVDPEDYEGLCVAAVTSGTGEHMATTMASQKCAERLYRSNRRGRAGASVRCTDEEAMESFIQSDFMDHPGVKASHSAGAIGVMAVKKTPHGYYFHFAHNTDSFALASMHSNERDAKCVMSRLGHNSPVVQGARKIRVD